MFDSQISPAVVGAIFGGLATIAFFIVAARKKMVIRAGRKMGMNFTPDLKCPNCSARVPAVRRPKNLRQALWGGFTCSNCGKEYDKWLKPSLEKK